MSTNKLGTRSMAPGLRGADNWRDPVQTYADLPEPNTLPLGCVVRVYNDPDEDNNGLWSNENGLWVQQFAMGVPGTNVLNAYRNVVTGASPDEIAGVVAGLTAEGGTIFLQSGVHQLTLASLATTTLKRLTLVGEGPATLLVLSADATPLMDFGGALEALELVNLSLVAGAEVPAANAVVRLRSTAILHQLRLDRVWFSGNIRTCLQVEASHVLIENCTASTTQTGDTVFVALGEGAQAVTLRNNQVQGFRTFCYGTADADEILLENNYWEGTETAAHKAGFLRNQGANQMMAFNNTVHHKADTGVTPSYSIALGTGTAPARFIIDGNVFTGGAGVGLVADEADTSSAGLVTDNAFYDVLTAVTFNAPGCVQLQMTSNTVDAVTGTGELVVVKADEAVVANNAIKTQGQVGIRVMGSRSLIYQNLVHNRVADSTVATIKLLPASGGTAEQNQVTGNVINRPIADGGLNTTLFSNLEVG